MNHSLTARGQLFSRLSVTILNTNRGTYGSSWATGGRIEHSDPFSRLYYLRSGRAELHLRKGLTRVVPLGLYLIPAYTPCRYRCPASMDLSYIHFSANIGGLGPLHHFVNWPVEVHPEYTAWVEERIDLLVDSENSASYLALDGALRQLLALFDEASGGKGIALPAASRFAPVLKYIESNLDRVIPLKELAGLAHLQPNYFSNLFCRDFGEPPTRYIQRRKIERAAEQLSLSGIPLAELADQLGFTDAFHLSRTFKAVMGSSPSDYRRMMKSAP